MAADDSIRQRKGTSSATKPGNEDSIPPFSSASSAPVTPKKSILADDNRKKSSVGFSKKDVAFDIPETYDTVDTYFPQNWSIASFFALVLVLGSAYVTVYFNLSVGVHVAYFLMWRLSYNVGLGCLLAAQSKHQWITKQYVKLTQDPSSWQAKLLFRLARAGVRDGKYQTEDTCEEFNAWLVYKCLVNVVLINDTANYLLLGFKCFSSPSGWSIAICAQYVLGVSLMVFNYWAKMDAHRCIGEYCWYWGDFFYSKTLDLTFDGIFELFPHPMYTVGYAGYYGYTMVCRSYTMLFVSIAAHILQMAFLVFVEEPHIARTYGTGGSNDALDANRYRSLYDRSQGWFPQRRDAIGFWRLNLGRSSDFAVLVFIAYGILFSSICPKHWCVVQVVVWKLIQWGGCGGLLYSQSKWQYYTRYYLDNGRTTQEAFSNWKRIYNLVTTMNVVVYLACAVRYCHTPVFSAYYCMCAVVGALLVLLSVYSIYSMYLAVGDFGWFYGDFFIGKDSYSTSLCYTGIYRFLNNPDCVTGYAYVYGLSLVTQSWTVFCLSLLAHVLNVVFVHVVEAPHMRMLYGEREIRRDAPIAGFVKKKIKMDPIVSGNSQIVKLKADIKSIRDKAVGEIMLAYGEMKKRAPAEFSLQEMQRSTTVSVAHEKHVLGAPLTINFSATPGHSLFDWVGIYAVDVPSAPGNSKGKWLYTEDGEAGTITFPPSLIPTMPGLYEVRYHLDNTYQVVATCGVVIEREREREKLRVFSVREYIALPQEQCWCY